MYSVAGHCLLSSTPSNRLLATLHFLVSFFLRKFFWGRFLDISHSGWQVVRQLDYFLAECSPVWEPAISWNLQLVIRSVGAIDWVVFNSSKKQHLVFIQCERNNAMHIMPYLQCFVFNVLNCPSLNEIFCSICCPVWNQVVIGSVLCFALCCCRGNCLWLADEFSTLCSVFRSVLSVRCFLQCVVSWWAC